MTGNPCALCRSAWARESPRSLSAAGQVLAAALKAQAQKGLDAGVLVSSDMNHYESESRTREKDSLALERALACDPEGLLAVTAQEKISMCGPARWRWRFMRR